MGKTTRKAREEMRFENLVYTKLSSPTELLKKITKILYCPPIKTKIFYSLISHVPVPSQNYFLHSKLHLKQLQMMMMLMLAEMQHSQRCEERRWEEMSASAAPNICHVKINVFFLTPRS